MKSFLYTFLCMGLSFSLFSQVSNDEINYEVQTSTLWSAVPISLDLFSAEDVRMVINVWDSDMGWGSDNCFFFETDGENYAYNHNTNLAFREGVPFDTELSFYLAGWEHNNIPHCEYNGDDQFYFPYYTDDYINNRKITWEERPILGWSNNWSTLNGEWLLPNGVEYPFNMILKTNWRYYFGEDLNTALNFGTINPGSSKLHYNSNRPAPAESINGGAMGYNDNGYQVGPDVYYRFELNQSASVTISTNHSETDFDTYLTLLNDAGEFITENDDVVPGSNTKSVIAEQKLCAGTYYIVAEGYSSWTGNFILSVEAESVGSISANPSYEYPECPGEAGLLTVNPTGGVPPYTFNFGNGQGTTSNNQGLVPWGVGFAVIYDACGNEEIFETDVDIANDQAPPVAVCDALSFTLDPGQTINLDVNNFGFNSTDNCGIESYTISPSSFSYDNAGINNVTLVVTDESGLESTCTGTVEIIQNTTTSSRELVQAISFSMNPNPASDYLQIGLTDVHLSQYTQVSILTITGQEVWKKQTNEDQTVDLSNFPRGLYLVRVQDGDKAGTRKLAIQ